MQKQSEQKLREYIRRCIKEVLTEVAPPGWEGTVKAMKKNKDIDNPWALAWYMKNKGAKSHKKEEQISEAAFSRQHYIKVANILKNSTDKQTIVLALADMFEEDNPLFSKDKFLKACGI